MNWKELLNLTVKEGFIWETQGTYKVEKSGSLSGFVFFVIGLRNIYHFMYIRGFKNLSCIFYYWNRSNV